MARREDVWGCRRCGAQIVLHVALNRPPSHPCGGSSRSDKFIEFELLRSTTATDSVGSDTYADPDR